MTRAILGYGRHHIDDTDIAAVIEVLRGDYLTQGPVVERFEAALASRVGARYAVALSSGTAALHVACLAAGLGPQSTAVVPTLTFCATANAPIYCGAQSNLADIDPTTLGLSAATLSQVDSNIPPAAVLPVHFAGLAGEMAAIHTQAGEATVIEDACHALGGTYEDGRPVGCCAYSSMAIFSFHPVKPITTAEGGAVVTNDPELARRLAMLRSHGIERDPARFVEQRAEEHGPWYYEQQELGFNYRLSDLQAALGLAQLDRLDGFLMRRREIAKYYDSAFQGLETIRVHQNAPEQRARSGMHLYILDIDFAALGMSRGAVMASLRNQGVGTQVHYIPLHRQPFHRDRTNQKPTSFPVAEAYYAGALSIPLYPSLSDAEVEHVAAAIQNIEIG